MMGLRQLLLIIFALQATAGLTQEININGAVTDAMDEPIQGATIRFMTTDSTLLKAVLTDKEGAFFVSAQKKGDYLLRVSNMGFKEVWKKLSLNNKKGVNLGKITLEEDSMLLDEAVVTANIPKMVVVDDTIMYNADAYRVPEGSTIEALVEQLPGAQIDDNGQITINGKKVKKVKVDGRDFMNGNAETTLKNLPSDIVDRIKAYDEQSDLAKMTGIDDGNEETILDFTIKKGMKKGFTTNSNGGIGTHDRYAARLMGSRFSGDLRYTIMGNANNNNDQGNGRRGRGGGGTNGQRSSEMMAVNINYDKKNKMKIDAGVNWNHSGTDRETRSSTENFVNKTGAFSNSISKNLSRSNSWSANMNMQWKPDTLTTISFRPNLNFSSNDNKSDSRSGSYKENPSLYGLNDINDINELNNPNSIVVNTRHNKSLSYSTGNTVSASLQIHRRLSRTGRNIALSSNFSYRDNENKSISVSNVHLYQKKDQFGNDSTYQTNRFNHTPSTNLRYSFGLTYTEPIMRAVFLQLNYNYNYTHNKSPRSTYDFPDFDEQTFLNTLKEYRDFDTYFAYLENPLDFYLDSDLSRYSEQRNHTHNFDTQLRIVRDHFNLNIGMNIKPQRNHFIRDYKGRYVDTLRTVTNISPTLNFRYRFTKKTNLRINYRGESSQPSIVQLLDINDDSNPLNIRMGNPGLKPSFSNRGDINFVTQRERYNQNLSWRFSANVIQNSIGNVVTYDEETGGRTTRPENINGNWGLSTGYTISTALDTLLAWNVANDGNMSYNHRVSYITLDRKSSSQRNYVRDYNYHQGLSIEYRNRWLSVSANGRVQYSHVVNELQPQNNRDTWNYNYGMTLGITAPWGTSVNTDIGIHSKRGYTEATFNTDEVIWNATISHSFLKRRALTISLQLFDILHQKKSFTQSISETSRNETQYNTVTSYAMLRVNFRANFFGRSSTHSANGDHFREARQTEGREFNSGEGRNRGEGRIRSGR